MIRRKFLASVLGGTGLLLARKFLAFPSLGRGQTLRVGVHQSLPPFLYQDYQELFIKPLAQSLRLPVQVRRLSTRELEQPGLDLRITSPSFHPRWTAARQTVGTLPFGPDRDQKLRWLQSADGEVALSEAFHGHGWNVRALSVGSDECGFFTTASLADQGELLRQGVVGHSRDQEDWYKQHGLDSRRLSPDQQIKALHQGEIHYTEVLTVAAWQRMVPQAQTIGLKFVRAPGLISAPVVLALATFDLHAKPWYAELLALTSDEWQSRARASRQRLSATCGVLDLSPERLQDFQRTVQALRPSTSPNKIG